MVNYKAFVFASAVAVLAVYGVSGMPSLAVYDDGQKDDRCRQPIRDECHILPERLWPIDEYSLVFWTYNPKTRVCMPNYSLNGIKNCPRNANLPKTKWECEELCGYPCIAQGYNHTEPGVCMHPEFCDIPQVFRYLNKYKQLSCKVGNNYFKCCPRGYSMPAPVANLLGVYN